MPGQQHTCSKCGGPMDEGFVVELTDDRAHPNRWVAGKPQRHYLRGLKLEKKRILPIATYRCRACGYLDSYAFEPRA